MNPPELPAERLRAIERSAAEAFDESLRARRPSLAPRPPVLPARHSTPVERPIIALVRPRPPGPDVLDARPFAGRRAAARPGHVVLAVRPAVAPVTPARPRPTRHGRRGAATSLIAAGATLVGVGLAGSVAAATRPRALAPLSEPAQSAIVQPLGSRADRIAALFASPQPARRTPVAPAALPQRVVAPALGIDAGVVPTGLTATGELEVPDRYSIAAWWRGGPRPGERGAAVLVGHVDSKRGPAVFHPLLRARPGDRVDIVREDGTRATFEVYRAAAFAKSRFPTNDVYGNVPGAELRLVTCSGDFDAATGHYRDNFVVFARAIPAS